MRIVSVLIALSMLLACGGGGGGSAPSKPALSIAIETTSIPYITPGMNYSFSAKASSGSVNWTCSSGTIEKTTGLYTAPYKLEGVTITATSTEDLSKYDTYSFTIKPSTQIQNIVGRWNGQMRDITSGIQDKMMDFNAFITSELDIFVWCYPVSTSGNPEPYYGKLTQIGGTATASCKDKSGKIFEISLTCVEKKCVFGTLTYPDPGNPKASLSLEYKADENVAIADLTGNWDIIGMPYSSGIAPKTGMFTIDNSNNISGYITDGRDLRSNNYYPSDYPATYSGKFTNKSGINGIFDFDVTSISSRFAPPTTSEHYCYWFYQKGSAQDSTVFMVEKTTKTPSITYYLKRK